MRLVVFVLLQTLFPYLFGSLCSITRGVDKEVQGLSLVPGQDVFRRARIFENVARNVNNKLALSFLFFC